MPKSAPHKKKDVSDIFLWVFRAGIGCVLMSALLFLLGLATDHWHKDKNGNYGLWNRCERGRCTPQEQSNLPDYHTATQVLQILATIVYALSPITHLLVYCVQKKMSSSHFRTRIFDVGYAVGTVFHVVSVIVFGSLHPIPDSLSWSYNLSGAGAAFAVVGIILVIVSRNKALRFFQFLPLGAQAQRRSRVDTLSQSSSSSTRAETPQSGSSTVSRNVFGPQLRQSMDSQSSIEVDIQDSLNQSDSSFKTPMSRQAFPTFNRTMSPGPSDQIPLRTLSINNFQKQHGVPNQVLHNVNNSQTSTSELGPLRTHYLPPLLETTPV